MADRALEYMELYGVCKFSLGTPCLFIKVNVLYYADYTRMIFSRSLDIGAVIKTTLFCVGCSSARKAEAFSVLLLIFMLPSVMLKFAAPKWKTWIKLGLDGINIHYLCL